MKQAAGTIGALLLAAAPAGAATLGEAGEAYRRNRVAEAEKLYAAVAADPAASAADRAASHRERARIAWLVDGRAQEALRHLAAARAAGDKPCETGWMEARVLREARRFRQALARRDALTRACGDPAERDRIAMQLIRARLEAGPTAADLPSIRAELAQLTPDIATSLEGATLRLEAALLAGDAPAALAAWKDYFWLTDTDAPQALARFGAAERFRAGLARDAGDPARLALLDLLVRAGFADPARRFAKAHGIAARSGATPEWKRISTYLDERRRVSELILRANRAIARRTGDGAEIEKATQEATRALMAAAGASGDPRAALLEHYGLFGTVGKSSDFASLHMGHAIEDRRQRVTQYGRSAEVRFVAVDNMVANGFESWLWDGWAATGGWSGAGVIVHVRPEYTGGPLLAADLRADTPLRREILARQKQRAAEDLAKLKSNVPAPLEGVADRLRFQIVDRIEAASRGRPGAAADPRRAFLEEYWRATIDHSIMVHEGRHAIEQAAAPDASKLDSTGLEYSAKLAELSLADHPRMGLWNIIRNVGGETAHGKAGARVLEVLRRWIEARPDQVLGYDPALPALAQLDKLSDSQIREAARAADPLAEPAPPR